VKTLNKEALLFFRAIPRKAIWGRRVVKDYFGYEDYPDGIGQTWAFADQPGNLSSRCIKGPFQGESLHTLWKNHEELFASRFQEFPFIISLVGPSEDLSIQVHPGKRTAEAQGFKMGKNEAWYFIRTDDSSIVYGHNAVSKEELAEKIRNEQWDSLFQTIPVHDGDFVYIPAGTIHAMGKNNIVYEIQQATDLTYRIYDYGRKDAKGNVRELHTEMALKSIWESQEEARPFPEKRTAHVGDGTITEYISNESFTVASIRCAGRARIKNKGYKLCTVVEGRGKINSQEIGMGDHFLISALSGGIETQGEFCLLITCEESILDLL
jgi:mannose-6-phosphate isomerase